MPEVVESCAFRQAVSRVGALHRALTVLAPLCGLLAAGARVPDRIAPGVAERVPPGDLADPVRDDDLADAGPVTLHVRGDLLQDPVVGRDGAGRGVGLQVRAELPTLGLGQHVDLAPQEVDARTSGVPLSRRLQHHRSIRWQAGCGAQGR